jgi:hypothetical protein
MIRPTVALLLIAGAAWAEVAPATHLSRSAALRVEGDRLVLEYRYGDAPYKPYVRRLLSPAGVNVLRDQIAEHPHHHGLMFAVGVDGVDFWAETPMCGRQVPLPLISKPDASGKVVARGLAENPKTATIPPGVWHEGPWASLFTQELDWTAPAGAGVLAHEFRSLTVERAAVMDSVLVERRDLRADPKSERIFSPVASLATWRTKLQPAEGRPSIKLSGSHYFGLGMRFVQSMDGADDFFTPEGKAAGETVRGNERLVRGKWCAYAAEADGKPVTVAMFDHPSNVRPAWWFIMAKPFAYLSATLNLHREPLTVEAGKPLVLTYGVAVWDGKVKADEIEKLYVRWLELPKPESAGAGAK